jgi:hypothetical protein
MANVDYYQNKLKALIDNPGSFSGTPGFKFAVDTAMDQLGRQNSSIRGSGAALTALSDRAGGMASQNYLQYLTNLGDLSGKEQQYDLGQTRNTNDLTLGTEANRLTGVRDANNFTLGQGRSRPGQPHRGPELRPRHVPREQRRGARPRAERQHGAKQLVELLPRRRPEQQRPRADGEQLQPRARPERAGLVQRAHEPRQRAVE